MTVGRFQKTITVRRGLRPPWRHETETISWKATGRPAMTSKARQRKRNRIARASRKANR